jgi:hypothetical protein
MWRILGWGATDGDLVVGTTIKPSWVCGPRLSARLEQPWAAMGSHGHPWATMDSHGQPWAAMGSHGQPWAAVGDHGQPWATMGSHGQPWAAIGSRGQPWAARGSQGVRARLQRIASGRPWAHRLDCRGCVKSMAPERDAEDCTTPPLVCLAYKGTEEHRLDCRGLHRVDGPRWMQGHCTSRCLGGARPLSKDGR